MTDQYRPEPTAGILIFNQKNEVLLTLSHKWFDKWVIPGGRVELGETLKQTAIREAKEETGLDIYDLKYVCFHEFIRKPAFYKKMHFIMFNFFARTKGIEPKLDERELQKYIWIKPEKALKELDIEKYTKKTLIQIIQNKLV